MKRHLLVLASVVSLAGLTFFYTNAPAGAQTPAAPPAAHHETHPKIRGAIAALEAAKAEMKAAAHDYGGHREAAVKECDAAIEQLRLALKFDK